MSYWVDECESYLLCDSKELHDCDLQAIFLMSECWTAPVGNSGGCTGAGTVDDESAGSKLDGRV